MRRIVTANSPSGKSYILSNKITNIETPLPNIDERFKFYNLWTTDTTPVSFNDNDPVLDKYVSTSPVKNGSLFRIVNYPPESVLIDKINSMSEEELRKFENKIGVKLSLKDKHPLMHMTNSIDYGIVISGEIYLVLDEEEVLLKPMDTIIQRKTYHAWSNRSEHDCVMAYVLLDAKA
ncbi:MAG: cupin domain-containing protein [Neisseriaceae bacterium]